MKLELFKMFKVIVFMVFCVVVCYSQNTAPEVYCGETPNNILKCLKNPHIISADVISRCRTGSSQSQCDIMNCAFRESSWLKDCAIDKPKIIAHLNQLAKDKPEWKKALEHAVPNCLERDLSPQGIFFNCPAYDIVHCVLISFIQQSEPTQWSTASECTYPRQYAGACAVCPSECFAPAIPNGSCNACYGVPRPAA